MKISQYLFPILSLTLAAPTMACDLCGCYTPRLEVAPEKSVGFYAGAAEQFTSFGTDRVDGHKVDNTTGQYLESSNTQFFIGAKLFHDRFSLQVNVPYIYRSFRRPVGFDIEHGHESGLGDVSLLASLVVFHKVALFHETSGGLSKDGKTSLSLERGEPDFTTSLTFSAGLKAPTGDESRVREEFNEVDVEGAPESGIHGHDLALGTGSWDGVFGAQFSMRYKAFFFDAEAQFTWRGQGHYSYRYANDFTWNGGPGVYLLRSSRGSLGVQCNVSGETKGTDTFLGESAEDTGVTSLYVGPQIVASFGRFNAEIGADIPVLMNTTSFQTTPDYRLRAGVTIRF
ncbi:MAG: hypothetical protein ABJF10_12355 [Chthoniobacter sp.]|uniref:hypothetical protein n=1 Tax=Chthoniobacter sp. TaxID=2510640 RepID=UPI0032A1C8BD